MSWTPNSLDWSKRVLWNDVTTWASENHQALNRKSVVCDKARAICFARYPRRAACLPPKLTLSLGSLHAQTTVTTCCYRLINSLESTQSLRINVQQDCVAYVWKPVSWGKASRTSYPLSLPRDVSGSIKHGSSSTKHADPPAQQITKPARAQSAR